MTPRRMAGTLALVTAPVAALAVPAPGAAQQRQAAIAGDAPSRTSIVAVSPVCAVLAAVCFEYERSLSSTTTVGFAATAFSAAGDPWRSADIKYRYYPNRRAPFGVSLTGALGYLHAGARATEDRLSDVPLTVDALALAAGGDYNLPLGRGRRVVLGVGVGQKVIYARNRFRQEPCVFICLDFNARLGPSVAAFPYARAVIAAAF